jgi:hypothetical protein
LKLFKLFLRVFWTVIIRCPENFDHPVFAKDMNNDVDILFHSLKFRRPDLSLSSGRKVEGTKTNRQNFMNIQGRKRLESAKKDRKLQMRYYDEQNNPEY